MIGVIADPSEHAVVREFFELFKTPWEFYRDDQHYEVILSGGDGPMNPRTRLLLVFGGRRLSIDAQRKYSVSPSSYGERRLRYRDALIPIYGSSITFKGSDNQLLVDAESGEQAAYFQESDRESMVRIGYDLFHEIRTLLTVGQPISNANIPTLDLHISLLRDLIIGSGVLLLEIPPAPKGYRLIACLTHDVDHPSIRRHLFDHTMLGFLYRATFGSFGNWLRRRVTGRQVWANWSAALRLPFVYLGLAKDFWGAFDRYPKLENPARSSFFFIPVKGYSGRKSIGVAPKRRASRYRAAEIAGEIQRLKSAGCEIGLHGIDAWLDSSNAKEEMEEIRRISGAREIGVRMHWLYFNEQSPLCLEKAGADYDSTVGYNETIGYRPGTTQIYKPLAVNRLLELPLHVMDTALFYRAHLDLTPREAKKQIGIMIDNAVRLGGCVTVNWHDRSVAPERGWGEFYFELVRELREKGAWLATAADAVAWFRKRRSVILEGIRCESDAWNEITEGAGQNLPELQFQFHNAKNAGKNYTSKQDAYQFSTRTTCFER